MSSGLVSKRQKTESGAQDTRLALFLLGGVTDEDTHDVQSYFGKVLYEELSHHFTFETGNINDLFEQFPDPKTSPVVFVGAYCSPDYLDILARLDCAGYRRTGASMQSMVVANDPTYFEIWAASRGLRNTPSKESAGVRADELVAVHNQGRDISVTLIAGEFTSWYELQLPPKEIFIFARKDKARYVKVRDIAHVPSVVSQALPLLRAFAHEMNIQDVLRFDIHLEGDNNNSNKNKNSKNSTSNGNHGNFLEVSAANVVACSNFEFFTANECKIYGDWLIAQTKKPPIRVPDGLQPPDCHWEVVVEGEGSQHAFEPDLELTRQILGVDKNSWHINWVKTPTEWKTNERAASSECVVTHDPARKLSEVLHDLVKCSGVNCHNNNNTNDNNNNNNQQQITNNNKHQTSSKPKVLWFLYDYNDGGEHLQWLEKQIHHFIIIAPTAESYLNSSSKLAMKKCFLKDGIPTAPYTAKLLTDPADFSDVPPWFVKQDAGAASVGIFADNKVTTPEDMKRVWERTEQMGCGVFAEHFARGRECTVLVAGSVEDPIVFPPIERVFHGGLSGHQEDSNWENFHFATPSQDDPWVQSSQILAKEAYKSIQASPYGRVDIRGNLVLEVNTVPAYTLTDLAYSLAKVLDGKPENWKKFWRAVWASRR